MGTNRIHVSIQCRRSQIPTGSPGLPHQWRRQASISLVPTGPSLRHNGPETRRRIPTSTNKHRQSVDLGEIMDQTWTLQKIKPAEPQSRASWGQRAACCAFFSARLTSTGRTQGRSRHLAPHERASFPFPARAGCCSTSIHAPGRRPSFVPTP